MPATYSWTFPLPRTHTGMLQANGTLGAMIWGGDNVLRMTLGRADLWDHRGGMPWTEKQSYSNIRECLESGDETRLRQLFESTDSRDGFPRRPSVIPVGRVDIDFGPAAKLRSGTLNTADGTVHIALRQHETEYIVCIILDMSANRVCIEYPAGLDAPALHRVPAWDYVGEHLESISFEPPRLFEDEDLQGWFQDLPADPGVCVICRHEPGQIRIAAERGDSPRAARQAAGHALSGCLGKEGYLRVARTNRQWWNAYWLDAAQVCVPDRQLQFLYDYGMYKFAGLTNPDGVPATLQGPWIEEYQMPPWSSDYHFNINVQMCYWPAYHGNRLDHLLPLFKLIESWLPVLRHNAKVFLGIDDGVMLPHAVDDRCTCMGGFWTGSIDHGCTAWVAQMMFRYFLCTQDLGFLRQTAYPFMKSTMRVYEGMLERRGRQWELPVSVSPEYRGSRLDAWGRNASFQLACIHRLCEDLVQAAETLGETPAAIWADIRENLPRACTIGPPDTAEIALWEGTPLEESHRHHSHLAGITPFDVFEWDDDTCRLIERSLAAWIGKGPGLWSGWCVPWASMIHTRAGNADAAELWLHIWQRIFTNEGHGTLHDVHVAGFSLMGAGGFPKPVREGSEIMQMDAGMSCVAAIHEMLLHERRGIVHLFEGAPCRWTDVSFENVRTAGAFVVGAERRAGRVREVRIASLAGGIIRLANPWPDGGRLTRGDQPPEQIRGDVLDLDIPAGETVTLNAT